MFKSNIVRLFKRRKGRLEYRVRRDYIRDGIATIPCQISDYNDVISPYSVKGNETLNPEFVEYVKTTAITVPAKYPIVLNIIGDCLSQEEKKTINDIILDDFNYDLGLVEREEKRHRRIFLSFFIALIALGIALTFTTELYETPRELIFILFWFMGETLCDYIFLTGRDLRQSRLHAGRLASIKVIFSDSYEQLHFSESDVEKLYSDIEKDVKDTRQKSE